MKIIRILFTVLCFSMCLSSFTQSSLDEIYNYDPHNIDALEAIIQLNNSSSRINLRSDYKIKNDSIYFYGIEQGNLVLEGKWEYVFDGVSEKEITLSFDRLPSSWSPRGYSARTYNKKNQLTRQTYSLWNGDYNNLNEDNPTVIRNYFYNLDENIDSILVQNASAIIEDIPHQKYVYIYNSNDQLISITENWWSKESNSYYSTLKTVYSYDNNNLIETLRLKFEDNQWVTKDSTVMNYDESANLILKDVFAVISNPNQLDPYTRDIYHYNIDDQLVMKDEYSLFHIPSNAWWGIKVKEYEYDNLGNFVFMSRYDSIRVEYERDIDFIEEYTHNTSLESKNVLLPRSSYLYIGTVDAPNHSQFNPILLYERYTGGGLTQIKEISDRTKYFYSDISTSNVNLIEDSNLKIFPNPCKDFIQFENSEDNQNLEIKLFDVKGQLLKKESITSGEMINVSKLNSGLYFYQIQDGKNLHTGRLIKI